MIQKIRVRQKTKNLQAENILREIIDNLKIQSVKNVEVVNVYRFENISKPQADILANKLLSEEIDQTYTINKSMLNGISHIFEISYKPGVMNPEVGSIIKAAHDLGIDPDSVLLSKEYGFYANISREDLAQIIIRLNLFNPTIEHVVASDDLVTTIPLMIMNDEELMILSKDKLFLNLEEMKIIQSYFKKIKRNPTDCELETIAQTWSEHCAHKTFKAKLIVDGKEKKPLIERIKKEALKHNKNIVSAFVDNSGVMDFYDGYAICGKAETHNSPSAIEPYGGAMTGSGGVFRDILGTGLGAKTIASTDIFCFAHPDLKPLELPIGCLPPDYLLKRVVAGVRDYGNRMGIPTNNGSVHFHNDFRAKPTVIVGAYGILPKIMAQKGKPTVGDIIIAVGGKTGRDGIHGATFSSAEMTDKTITVNSSSVQIGNAIEEKRMFDAILEARDKNLIRAIQDCGAGGFSSAIGEIGEDIGVTINLEKAPLKYEGLKPWEIWVSESQERMIIITSKKNVNKFLAICKKYNVEGVELGKFDGSKRLRLYFEDEVVSNLDMKFLHKGLPQRTMKATKPIILTSSGLEPKQPKTSLEWTNLLHKIVSHGNVCSKEPIVRMYDHSVQGTNDLQPFSGTTMDGPNDSVALRPFLDKPYGVLIAHGLNPVLNKIDPYWGSIWAGVEALSNYTAVGGDYKNASLINNYIWPFPDEESLWSLDKSVDAVLAIMNTFKIPVISGKDSLSSTYKGKDGMVIKIPPVLCISIFGKIPNSSKTTTSDFKKKESVICLIGKPDLDNLGGSTYFDIHGIFGDSVPKTDLKLLPTIFETIYKEIANGSIISCHDISEGGLITALFEMCVGGGVGANVILNEVKNLRPDYFLFSETAGTFLAEVANEETAQKIFKNIPFQILGKTEEKPVIAVRNNNKILFNIDVNLLKKSWQNPMKKLFP